jgi:hypothetical protein
MQFDGHGWLGGSVSLVHVLGGMSFSLRNSRLSKNYIVLRNSLKLELLRLS